MGLYFEKLYILLKKREIYIVNPQDDSINKLIYSTNSNIAYGDESLVTSTPQFEIKKIPPKSYFKIEEVDPYEDGVIIYYADEIHWANGEVDKTAWILEKKEFREKTFFVEGDQLEESKVELKVTKIGEKPSYVLGKDGKKKDNI